MKECIKDFRILEYPATYHYLKSKYIDCSQGFIFIRYSSIPEDFEIFTRYRDAFKAVIEYGL